MDYIGDDPSPNPDTSGLIVDDVSCREHPIFVCQSALLFPQIMHEIMVKPLPPQCRLTAVFDVSLRRSTI